MHKIKNNPTNKDDAVNKKYVDDNIINKLDNTIILNNADEVNSFNKGYQSFIVEPSVADEIGLPNSPSSTWFCIHYSHSKGFEFPSQIAFEYAGLERIMYRTCGNGVWHNWRKVCTTSVADVVNSVTDVSTLGIAEITDGLIIVNIKNGWCQVLIQGLVINSTFSNIINIPVASLPKPVYQYNWVAMFDYNSSNSSSGSSTNITFVKPTDDSRLMVDFVTAKTGNYFTTFSYPVSES